MNCRKVPESGNFVGESECCDGWVAGTGAHASPFIPFSIHSLWMAMATLGYGIKTYRQVIPAYQPQDYQDCTRTKTPAPIIRLFLALCLYCPRHRPGVGTRKRLARSLPNLWSRRAKARVVSQALSYGLQSHADCYSSSVRC